MKSITQRGINELWICVVSDDFTYWLREITVSDNGQQWTPRERKHYKVILTLFLVKFWFWDFQQIDMTLCLTALVLPNFFQSVCFSTSAICRCMEFLKVILYMLTFFPHLINFPWSFFCNFLFSLSPGPWQAVSSLFILLLPFAT